MDATRIRAAFDRDGVYMARGVFDRTTVRQLELDFDRIVTQLASSNEDIDATWATADRRGDQIQVVLHTHNVQNYSPKWLQALLDPRFLDVAEAILGPTSSSTTPSCSRSRGAPDRRSRITRTGVTSRRLATA